VRIDSRNFELSW